MSDCYAVSDMMDMIRRYITECQLTTSKEPTLLGFYHWCKEHGY